ncbi:MAG: acyl-CoA thioester hydrolase [Verrucomicrobiales bacterium]|jgi:acyl-CoA thioester hydrolase
MPVHRFVHTRLVEFPDTDAAGIMHFSNFFRFMEVAEHAFYRSLGFSVHEFRPDPDGPKIGWPRVHASADFKLPLKFEDEARVELLIERIGRKSISYQFRVLKSDGENEQLLAATGKFTVVCVQLDAPDGRMRGLEIPAGVRAKIEEAPGELLDSTEAR